MAEAAYIKKVRVSTDGTTWHNLPCNSPSLDLGSEVVDDTNLATNDGFRSRVQTLHDWSISADSFYEAGDAAIMAVRESKLNRTPLHVQYLPRGAATAQDIALGFQGQVVVENFNLSGDVGGVEMVGISLQGNGTLSPAT